MIRGLFYLGFAAVFSSSLATAQGEPAKDPEKRSDAFWEHIAACVRESPDVVLVCEYAQAYEEENRNYWELVTSCTVVQSEKGSLKRGEKIIVRRMIEKSRKDEPVPKSEPGNLRYLFYDAAKGWVDTGSGSPFDEEIEKRVKADVAQQRTEKAPDR